MVEHLYLGFNESEKLIKYPQHLIQNNVGIIGKTGSGKSVLTKSIVEECIRLQIPTIILDRSGDMASLGLKHSSHSETYYDTYERTIKDHMNLRLFTLSSRSAIPVGITLFPDIEVWSDYPDFKFAIRKVVDILLEILNLRISQFEKRFTNKYLQELLEKLYEAGKPPKEIIAMRNLILNDVKYLPSSIAEIISDEIKRKIINKLSSLSLGSSSLIFDVGVPFRIDHLLDQSAGTPVNIFHLLSQRNRKSQYQFILYFLSKVINDLNSVPLEGSKFVLILENIVDLFPNKRGYDLFLELIDKMKTHNYPIIFTSSDPSNLDPHLVDLTDNFFIGNLPYSTSMDYIKYKIGGGKFENNNFDNRNNEFQLISNTIEVNEKLILPRLISDHRTLSDDELKSLSQKLNVASKWRRIIH